MHNPLRRHPKTTRPGFSATTAFAFALFTALAFALATPGLATTPPPGGSHAAETEGAHGHGDDAHGDDAHGDDAHGDDAHGDHGDHHYYSADDDNDGIANWRDPMNGDQPNEDTYVLDKLVLHAINLALLVALLLYFVRQPIADALRTRALTIRKDLTDSARARDEANQHHEEVSARLVAIETEIQALRNEAIAEAAILESKLVERARDEAERIAAGAERKIRDEAQRARLELRRDAVQLAVELAETTLRERINAEDQQRLAREFLTAIHDDGAPTNV